MNRKKTYIGIAVVVLIFGILVLPNIFERIKNNTAVESTRLNVANIDRKESPKGQLSYITINGKDRRVPEFKFINQEGDTITDKDYRGKVFLVEFFFTRCKTICIPMNANLVEIQNVFKEDPNFGIVSFTIDPEHDTPEVLQEYATRYGVTDPDWNFLTGNREEIHKLATEGFNLLAQENPDLEDDFQHSGLFALVDQNGFIRSRMDNFGNPLIYYRGFVPPGTEVQEGEETSQIDILIEDIKLLLKKK